MVPRDAKALWAVVGLQAGNTRRQLRLLYSDPVLVVTRRRLQRVFKGKEETRLVSLLAMIRVPEAERQRLLFNENGRFSRLLYRAAKMDTVEGRIIKR